MVIRSHGSGCLVLIAAIILVLGGIPRASAQGGGTLNPPGGTTIHIVQRDENLFRIAMQYGTTVEAISAANGISDPRTIAVGQRLLIPNAQANSTGALVTHVVQPGDSIATLTRLYQTTAAELAAANHICNPAQLYVGQALQISQGSGASGTASAVPYRVGADDNLYRIALRHHVSLNSLLKANDLSLPAPVTSGQRLWIPTAEQPASVSDLPLPFASYTLLPVPPVQGGTLEVRFTTVAPADISGTFLDAPLHLSTQDAVEHTALVGIDRFTPPGIYPLTLTATSEDGTQSAVTLRVKIDSGRYGTESIILEAGMLDLLNPDITEPEWQRLVTVTGAFTAQRYFDGLMGLPSSGAITSQYGTQRDYNSGSLHNFHSGTDFGGGPGSPVLAPAAGVVVLAEPLPVRGNATIIDHGWGVYTGYWHQAELRVRVGDVVSPGQVIGTIGSTGRVTGPHLHWELWVGGVQVDPMQWVRQGFP